MSIPNVSLTFVDGGLGGVLPGPGGAQAKIGVSLSGTPLSVYAIGTSTQAVATLEGGPLCDATAQVTDVAGTPVYAVPCAIVTHGSVTATFTQVGSGAGAVTAIEAPHAEIKVKISGAGTLGTMTAQFGVGGAAYGAPVTSAAGWSSTGYRVPGTFCTIVFAAGTYVISEVYTIATTGVITQGATGPTISFTASPVDAYDVDVTIETAGDRGVARFTYSLDGGAVVSAPILTAATYVIPNSGIVLAFSNAAYVLDDVYSGTAIPPATDNTEIGLAFDAIKATSYQIEGIHVVGTPSSAANAATLATAVDGKMTAAAVAKRYQFALVECPQTEGDAAMISAFTTFESSVGRTCVCGGDAAVISPITGLTLRRNGAWVVAPRLASSKMSENPGKVKLGAIPNVRSIYRDEEATPGLGDARFITLRTIQGKSGYYITDGPTMASLVSDYRTIMNVRVVNRAAAIASAAFAEYMNGDVRIDSTTGFIDERDALGVDNDVSAQLQAALQGTPGSVKDEVSRVWAQMSRDDNLLSDPEGTATVRIIPKGYLRSLSVQIGFVNPAISG